MFLERLLGQEGGVVYDRAWIGIGGMFFRRSETDAAAAAEASPRDDRRRSATHMSRRGAQFLDIGLHRMLGLSVTQPLPDLVARLNDFQPNHLNGYPSVIGLLAEELAGRLRLQLDALFTSSEPLSPALRAPSSRHLVCVRSTLRATEGLSGHDCPERSMHLIDDRCRREPRPGGPPVLRRRRVGASAVPQAR